MCKIIEDGDEFFEELWRMIDNSEKCCWILTYHMVDDSIANTTLTKLIQAAKRGVSVVLFVDNLNFWLNPQLAQELMENGGIVKSLNPLNPITRFMQGLNVFTKELWERYHQKLFLIDETVIVGSANLDEAYGGIKYGTQKFQDLNILLYGVCVAEAQEIFKRIASRYSWQIDAPILHSKKVDDIEILVSEPHYLRWDIQERVLQMIDKAEHELIILQGYYYPIDKIIKAVERSIERNVDVKLITSKIRDQPAYKYLHNSRLTKSLRRKGVKVYEYPDRVFHMKGYIIDGKEFTIGSFNQDRWSWSLNNELNLYIRNPEITQDLQEKIQNILNKCQKVEEYKLPWWHRLLYDWWTFFIDFSERIIDRRDWMKLHLKEAYFHHKESARERMKRKIIRFKSRQQLGFQNIVVDTYI